ncbi:MAG TPA: response regulator [Candidatus Dormibacteraeota bacterium]|nr:response regulator [Candidatus Dormibacteraeota bacterium]
MTVSDPGLILVVDDYDALRELTSDLLTEEGYEVMAVATAAEALEAASRTPNNFRLLVTDVNLGGMSGVELACAMRAVSPGLPVLYLSGERVPGILADELLLKPFEVAEFSAKVGKLMAKSWGRFGAVPD